MKRPYRSVLAACAAMALCVPAARPALAADPAISLELNNAQDAGKGCRLSVVMKNAMAAPVDDLALEIVIFDGEGRVSEFVVLKAGSLPAGKSRARQFDLAGHACNGISRILLNDVKSCTVGAPAERDCLGLLSVKSATAIELTM